MEFQEFVLQHEGDDLTRLVLSRDRYPGLDVALAVSTIESRRKLRDKVPEWYACPDLVFPAALSAEQCSSSATASYKAALVSSTGRGWPAFRESGSCRIADLTGGLGVDSWAFAKVFGEVLYNEMSASLAEAARHNFRALGVENIRVESRELGAVPLKEILGDFEPDMIYLDPARRGTAGNKVFLLEDCSPDVTALLPELLEAAPRLLLKLSPMADIAMVLGRLRYVKELHVVAVKGECKELLVLLERGFAGEPEMVAAGIPGGTLRFTRSEEAAARATLEVPESGMVLFEPGKALSKAGCFNLLSKRGSLGKIGRDTHLYLGKEAVGMAPMGKCFRIREVLPLDKRTLAAVAGDFPGADVTARGIPMSSEELAARLRKAGKKKARGGAGGAVHLFGVHCDLLGRNLLLVTERIGTNEKFSVYGNSSYL